MKIIFIMKSHIPNLLTLSRGILTLFIILLFSFDFSGKYFWILGVFSLASFTDYLDGFLARKWNVVSTIGVVFDSLLDKILILSMFFLLAPYNIIPLEIFLLLFLREILVDGVKNYLLSQKAPVPAVFLGKLKMVFQVILIIFCLLALSFYEYKIFIQLSYLFAGASLFASYWSAGVYVKKLMKYL